MLLILFGKNASTGFLWVVCLRVERDFEVGARPILGFEASARGHWQTVRADVGNDLRLAGLHPG